jgi:hypothetical protein
VLLAERVEHGDGDVLVRALVAGDAALRRVERVERRRGALVEHLRGGVEVAGERHLARRERGGLLAERQRDVADAVLEDAVDRGAALHDEAVGRRDEAAVGVELEVARARVEELVALRDDEERVALDREVGAEAGGLDVALREEGVDRRDLRAEADLHGIHAALVARRARGAGDELREAFLEGDAARLERDGVDVGDVVADDVEAQLVVAQAGDAAEQ